MHVLLMALLFLLLLLWTNMEELILVIFWWGLCICGSSPLLPHSASLKCTNPSPPVLSSLLICPTIKKLPVTDLCTVGSQYTLGLEKQNPTNYTVIAIRSLRITCQDRNISWEKNLRVEDNDCCCTAKRSTGRLEKIFPLQGISLTRKEKKLKKSFSFQNCFRFT